MLSLLKGLTHHQHDTAEEVCGNLFEGKADGETGHSDSGDQWFGVDTDGPQDRYGCEGVEGDGGCFGKEAGQVGIAGQALEDSLDRSGKAEAASAGWADMQVILFISWICGI